MNTGDPRVVVAMIDGPVDLTHPALRGSNLWTEPGRSNVPSVGRATDHGTAVASILFGSPKSGRPGIASGCRGLSIPIFANDAGGTVRPASQFELARAITTALEAGARLINISGGEFSPTGAADPALAEAVRDCVRRGVLIVAAVGNQGCECLHVPAAMEGVLAVGAVDGQGEPLEFSNWGDGYQDHGIVVPGETILVAEAGGGYGRRTGTSFSAAIVTGVAALLVSEQLARGQPADPFTVRDALIRSADRCDSRSDPTCPRQLTGRLNLPAAYRTLFEEPLFMSESSETLMPSVSVTPSTPVTPGISPSECGCGGPKPVQMVYALGQLGYDLIGEARADSLAQAVASTLKNPDPTRALVAEPRHLITHLRANPWDAASVEWTLSLEGSTIYAIRPRGPFAAATYGLLVKYLQEQLDDGVERISLPGRIAGEARLMSGQTVPVVVPEQRGMFSWDTKSLIDTTLSQVSVGDRAGRAAKEEGVRDFLARVYYGHRNVGVTPQDRALNFAATNAFNVEKVYEKALNEKMELESIAVTASPYCRPGSDCWDVEIYFFYPDRPLHHARKVHRFTVDVSDVVPVTVGPVRSWFVR